MRWEDEQFVKVYTRDTGDWLALGWEAQALFLLLLRKVDRAGLLHVGRSRRRGVAGMTGMPLDVVERTLPVLLEDGCLKECEAGYLVPNFIAAQEARQSDRARKAAQRQKDRDIASAEGFEGSASAADSMATTSRAESKDGFVYVVQDPDTKLVKIGFTASPKTRLPNILSGRPIITLALVEGSRGTEREFHQKWAEHRTHGEWFTPVESLLAWADGLRPAGSSRAVTPAVTAGHTASHGVTLRLDETREDETRRDTPFPLKGAVVGTFSDAVEGLLKQRDPTWAWSTASLRALAALKGKGTPDEVLRRLRMALAWPRSFPTWSGLQTLVQHWDAYAQPASALLAAPDPDDPGKCEGCGSEGSTKGWGDARLGSTCGCAAAFLATELHYTEAPGWAASRRKEASHGH